MKLSGYFCNRARTVRHLRAISALNCQVKDRRIVSFGCSILSIMDILSGACRLFVDLRQTVPTPAFLEPPRPPWHRLVTGSRGGSIHHFSGRDLCNSMMWLKRPAGNACQITYRHHSAPCVLVGLISLAGEGSNLQPPDPKSVLESREL